MAKTNPGRFFEDYRIGETISHAVPRTVSGGASARSITRSTRRAMRFIRRMSLPATAGWTRRRSTIWPPSTWFLARPYRMCR